MKEIWKDIPMYEGHYQVSNLGRVKSIARRVKRGNGFYFVKERVKSEWITKNGYATVNLAKDKASKIWLIHQLVLMAFEGYIPNGRKYVVDHINEIKTDNRLTNLQVLKYGDNVYKSQQKRGISSMFRGVSWHVSEKKWYAGIRHKGKMVHAGAYDDEFEAYLGCVQKRIELGLWQLN